MACPAAMVLHGRRYGAGVDTALPSYDPGFTTPSGPNQKAGRRARRTLVHGAVNGEARRAGAQA